VPDVILRPAVRLPPCLFSPKFPPHMKAFFLTLLTLSVAIQLQAGLITKPVMYEHNGAKLTGYLAYDDSVTAKGKARRSRLIQLQSKLQVSQAPKKLKPLPAQKG
jgi:hypothetical protein